MVMLLNKVVKTGLIAIMLLTWSMAQAAGKQVIGWVEDVHINEARMNLVAKIDTGADKTSVKAKILKKFKRDGQEWVRFRIIDKHSHSVELERRIERYARIKRKMCPTLRRPVVKLGICLGNIFREVEVNLAKRKGFKYNMLIGRNFLQGVYLVDSALQYESQPQCPGIKGD